MGLTREKGGETRILTAGAAVTNRHTCGPGKWRKLSALRGVGQMRVT